MFTWYVDVLGGIMNICISSQAVDDMDPVRKSLLLTRSNDFQKFTF